MNILEILGWWTIKGIIAWAVIALVTLVCMMVYALDEEKSEAMDKAIDELPSKKPNVKDKITGVIELILWPIGVLHVAWWLMRVTIRAEEIRGET